MVAFPCCTGNTNHAERNFDVLQHKSREAYFSLQQGVTAIPLPSQPRQREDKRTIV